MSRSPDYPTIEDSIGNTPMVRLVRLPGEGNETRGNVIRSETIRRGAQQLDDTVGKVGHSSLPRWSAPSRQLAPAPRAVVNFRMKARD